MLTTIEIRDLADEVLRAKLGPFGFERSDVADDVDIDGEQAVRVTAHFLPGSGPADAPSVMAALTELRARLKREGEARFPFVRYAYPDDDMPYADPEDFEP
ncbi:hypothetical protein [uncultured Methylobacterium sp.]|uniref:hypothetical protein n=1 Tax=uncultured Methylobacterium sp. TaxID=157278 RepID=UPI0035CBA61A